MSDLHALLIGIEAYPAHFKLKGSVAAYEPLPGCVADVEAVARYLEDDLGVRHITRLTSPAGDGAAAPAELRPTYENIVGAMLRIVDEAAPGDQIYIHYSGHGGVIPTLIPKIKGDRAYDETWVPVNIDDPQARHVRDVEQVVLLRRMCERGLYVTVVLDCCHSGGALRGSGAMRGPGGEIGRGVPQPDMTPRPLASLAGSPAELADGWGKGSPAGTRDGSPAFPLRTNDAWVLLAACQANEQAFGMKTPEGGSHGALTYEWLAALRGFPPGRTTYGEIFDHIYPRIHRLSPQQKPALYGDRERRVFGKDRISRRSTVAVTSILANGRDLHLGTGPIHGVFEGARFGIYPKSCELADPVYRVAEAEVIKLSAADALARVVGSPPEWPDPPDLQAMLLHPGSVQLQSCVEVRVPDDVAPPARGRKALDELRKALLEDRSGFLRLAVGSDKPNFQVGLDDQGDWQIRDPWGEPITFPIVPPVPGKSSDSINTLVRYLAHLAKFSNLDHLVNLDPESPLLGKLDIAWESQPGKAFLRLDGKSTGRLRIVNRSSSDLQIAVLILRSDGSIQWSLLGPQKGQVVLLRRGEKKKEGEKLELEISPRPMEGRTRVTERIKVFASLRGIANYGWLELPSWEGTAPSRPVLRSNDSLERILASLAGEWPTMRQVVITGRSEMEWTVETLELEYEIEA